MRSSVAWPAAAVLLAAAGCGAELPTSYRAARYDALVRGWVHAPVRAPIAWWGPATKVTPLPDGTRAFEWDRAIPKPMALTSLTRLVISDRLTNEPGYFDNMDPRGIMTCLSAFQNLCELQLEFS